MEYYQIVLVVIFGLIIGSFLNSLIYRLQNTENLKAILKERSHCPRCRETLRFWDLIPLFSFLLLRAKCKYCKKPISWQYPLIELATGGAFLLIFLSFGLTWIALLWAIIAAIFIVLFTYDLLHAEIPIFLIWIGLVAAVAIILIDIYSPSGFIWSQALDYIYGALALGGFLGLLVLISWEKWMGVGDIWLGTFIGLLVGLNLAILTGFLGFVIGALFSLGLIVAKKKKLKDQIPFGPFLIIGLVISLIWGEQIVNWYLQGSYLAVLGG